MRKGNIYHVLNLGQIRTKLNAGFTKIYQLFYGKCPSKRSTCFFRQPPNTGHLLFKIIFIYNQVKPDLAYTIRCHICHLPFLRQAHRHSVLDSQFKDFFTVFIFAFKKDPPALGIRGSVRIHRMPTVRAPDFFLFYFFNLNHLRTELPSSVPVLPSADHIPLVSYAPLSCLSMRHKSSSGHE